MKMLQSPFSDRFTAGAGKGWRALAFAFRLVVTAFFLLLKQIGPALHCHCNEIDQNGEKKCEQKGRFQEAERQGTVDQGKDKSRDVQENEEDNAS